MRASARSCPSPGKPPSWLGVFCHAIETPRFGCTMRSSKNSGCSLPAIDLATDQRSRLSEEAMGGIPDFANDLIGEADPAKNLVFVGFPETLVRLPTHLADRGRASAVHRLLELVGKIAWDLL